MQAEIDRLFFALWPDPVTRAALAGSATHLRNKLHPVGRWVDAQHYHLTLHFLGTYSSFPDALVQRAMTAGAAAAKRSPPFAMKIEQASCFRDKAIPWWLGPAQTPPGLKHLWRELREAFQRQAVPHDTRLKLVPHVTVLRDAAQRLASTPVPAVDWAVESFVLIHSRGGALTDYRVLDSWSLIVPDAGKSTPKPGPAQRDLWDT